MVEKPRIFQTMIYNFTLKPVNNSLYNIINL